MIDRRSKPHYFVKHSALEFGQWWWFLDELSDSLGFMLCNTTATLKSMKESCSREAKFVKRFSSEEELDMEVFLKHGTSFKMKTITQWLSSLDKAS